CFVLFALYPFGQMLAGGAEVQWLAHSALIHLSDNFSAMALCQPSFSRQFFKLFPFVGKFLRQFPVRSFCAPFEPPDPSITSHTIVTGDPERAFRRLMTVFSD